MEYHTIIHQVMRNLFLCLQRRLDRFVRYDRNQNMTESAKPRCFIFSDRSTFEAFQSTSYSFSIADSAGSHINGSPGRLVVVVRNFNMNSLN